LVEVLALGTIGQEVNVSSLDPILANSTEAARILALPEQELDWLISTQQLRPIFIHGHCLFLIEDLRRLARDYQAVQHRDDLKGNA
jgi:hypothetical protein